MISCSHAFSDNHIVTNWVKLAREHVPFQGLPARIAWLGHGERTDARPRSQSHGARGRAVRTDRLHARPPRCRRDGASQHHDREHARRLRCDRRLAAAQCHGELRLAGRSRCHSFRRRRLCRLHDERGRHRSLPTAPTQRTSVFASRSPTTQRSASCAMPMPAMKSRSTRLRARTSAISGCRRNDWCGERPRSKNARSMSDQSMRGLSGCARSMRAPASGHAAGRSPFRACVRALAARARTGPAVQAGGNYAMPVVGNLLNTRERIAQGLGIARGTCMRSVLTRCAIPLRP